MQYKELKEAWANLTATGGPFEIETIDVRGVSLKSYKNAPANLRDIWKSSKKYSDNEYLIYQDERITYLDAHLMCERVSGWLCAQGVEPGDRVAIAMRNYPEWMLIFWSCMNIGATVVGMNAWWSAAEAKHAVANTKPKVIFADKERMVQFTNAPLPNETKSLVIVREKPAPKSSVISWSEVISHDPTFPEVIIDPDSNACLFYTSGTTGASKGAEITHRSAVCNIFNVLFAGNVQNLAKQTAQGINNEVPSPPAALITTPLFHVTANNCAAQIATALGGKIVLMYRWDAGNALSIIEKERITTMSGVPVMGRELLNHPDFFSSDTSCLENIGGGGAPLQPDFVEKVSVKTPNLSISSGYGMTEASGVIASISGDFLFDKPTSCGPVVPALEIKFMDDNGHELPKGETGELWIKGASVVKGYFEDQDATSACITDGWLRTGDLARIDEDQFLYIVDRKKDMVLRGGENVFCSEVEAVLYRHPAIIECCVFSVLDQRLGETVGAAILTHKDTDLTPEKIRQHCKEHLAAYKIPEAVWFLDQPIPRNASGKFVKKKLREMVGAEAPH
ncbi:class I adenylate-forming enzyme family protein [Kordiimonas sp.]|uniref:class I adenylate-forming enzyme family protein n=1 Tax=Kordiimonas sp. TaxID=1970157 RepID=UPI003A8E9A0E